MKTRMSIFEAYETLKRLPGESDADFHKRVVKAIEIYNGEPSPTMKQVERQIKERIAAVRMFRRTAFDQRPINKLLA